VNSPTEHRRAFDAAITRLRAGDRAGALAIFTDITTDNPAMSDAWMGRLACGDHSLDALAGAHHNSRALYRESRRIGLEDGNLQATVAAPLYLPLTVWSRASVALGYASALVGAGRFADADQVLNDAALTEDTQAEQLRQFVSAALYHRTARWTDVRAVTEACPPPTATYTSRDVTAATLAIRAAALASLGQAQPALEVIAAIDTPNELVTADAALTKGWCLRELGQEDEAQAAFRAAAVDGQLIPQARDALDNPHYRIVVTDPESIASRTDKWDPTTEVSPSQRASAELAARRREVLGRAQARIDELIGLEEAKEQIAVWRTEIQIDQLLAEQGQPGASSNENHMVFLGPPGTAKTTFARVVGEVLFGLGKIARPDVKEVTEEDIVVGYISQTAAKMKEVCEQARGGVLFIDEAYRLVPKTEGHSFGLDAINTLLKYMEDLRGELVVIVAGYPEEMKNFLNANVGLASRFHFTLSFTSYTADEILAIAQQMASTERLVVGAPAWELLHEEATRLRGLPAGSGTLLDVAGNGRYARKVVIACKRERARRLHRLAPAPDDLEALVRADPGALNVNEDDMARALAESRPAAG
jgi:type VII secretion ATPase EccA